MNNNDKGRKVENKGFGKRVTSFFHGVDAAILFAGSEKDGLTIKDRKGNVVAKKEGFMFAVVDIDDGKEHQLEELLHERGVLPKDTFLKEVQVEEMIVSEDDVEEEEAGVFFIENNLDSNDGFDYLFFEV